MTSEHSAQRKTTYSFVNHILTLLENRKENAAELAALRRGLSPHTDVYALPYVAYYYASDREIAAMSRLAGLITTFSDIDQIDKEAGSKSFGRYCAEVSYALGAQSGGKFTIDPAKPDVIAQRLRSMPAYGLEGLASSVRSILSNARRTSVAIDFHQLAVLFLRWGNGLSEESRYQRQRPIRDYYQSANVKAHPNEK